MLGRQNPLLQGKHLDLLPLLKVAFLLLGLCLGVSGARAADAPVHRLRPPLLPLFVVTEEVDGRSRESVCTGAVIAPRLVLTAAHCVRDFPYPAQDGGVMQSPRTKALHLEEDRWWGTKEIDPLRVHVFPGAGYVSRPEFSEPVFVGDIAIVEFEEPVRIGGKRVGPEQFLQVKESVDPRGARGWMSGYSHRISPSGDAGDDMRDRTSESELRPRLVAGVNSVKSISPDYLVVEGVARDCGAHDIREVLPQPSEDWSLCHGDSGGPFVDLKSGRALGVASVIQDAGGGRRHSFYVNLSNREIQEFIRGVMARSLSR